MHLTPLQIPDRPDGKSSIWQILGLHSQNVRLFWDYNPKKAEHSGNVIPIFAKLKTYRRDGQGFGGASNAFAKLAGSAGSWSILSGETTVTGMFG